METLVKENKTSSTNSKKKETKRIFQKLGYTKDGSEHLVEEMNSLLANYHLFYQKLRNFHWNVKGPDFFDLHQQFEEMYDQAKLAIDSVAERIRVFGHTPMSNYSEFLEHSEIVESPKDVHSSEMVKIVLSDMRIVLEKMFDVLDQAITNGDSGTEDMMKDYIQYIEKKHWMLSSFIDEE